MNTDCSTVLPTVKRECEPDVTVKAAHKTGFFPSTNKQPNRATRRAMARKSQRNQVRQEIKVYPHTNLKKQHTVEVAGVHVAFHDKPFPRSTYRDLWNELNKTPVKHRPFRSDIAKAAS